MAATRKDKALVLGLIVKSDGKEQAALKRAFHNKMDEDELLECLEDLEKNGAIVKHGNRIEVGEFLRGLMKASESAIVEAKRDKTEFGIPRSMIESLKKRRNLEY